MTRAEQSINLMLLFVVLFKFTDTYLTGCDLLRLRFNHSRPLPYTVLKKEAEYEKRAYVMGGFWLKKYPKDIPLFELLKSNYSKLVDSDGNTVKLRLPVLLAFSHTNGFPVYQVQFKLFNDYIPKFHDGENSKREIFQKLYLKSESKITVHVMCFQRIFEDDVKGKLNDLRQYIGVDNNTYVNHFFGDYYVNETDVFPFTELMISFTETK